MIMSDKNVLVTGANGGLGIPVVNQLLEEGWKVYAFIRTEKSEEEMRVHFPGKKGQHLFLLPGDVMRMDDIEKAVNTIKIPDALVHLAGGFKGAATYADQALPDFDYLFDLNVRSTFLWFKAILPVMKQHKKGAIVTIGAKPALHAGKENAVYAASKAALINMTLTAAEEGRKANVRANVIVPQVIRTKANKQWASSPEEIEKWTPPEDIAKAISWLISDQGASITGTVIPMFNQMR